MAEKTRDVAGETREAATAPAVRSVEDRATAHLSAIERGVFVAGRLIPWPLIGVGATIAPAVVGWLFFA